MLVTLSGIVNEPVKPLHSWNAYSPMLVTGTPPSSEGIGGISPSFGEMPVIVASLREIKYDQVNPLSSVHVSAVAAIAVNDTSNTNASFFMPLVPFIKPLLPAAGSMDPATFKPPSDAYRSTLRLNYTTAAQKQSSAKI